MNRDEDKAWEARLDRALKDLPELSAPADLVEGTLTALERRRKPAWCQPQWTLWPPWLRTVSLVSMITLLGASCAVIWDFPGKAYVAAFSRRLGNLFAGWDLAVGTLDTLAHAALTAVRHLDDWMVILGVVMAAVAYAACIGLGATTARLVFARR
jgi:hypothetical protein